MSNELKELSSNLLKAFDEGRQKLVQEIDKRTTELDRGLEKLREEKKALENEKNKVNHIIGTKDGDVIEINVGGRHFTTKRSTITQVEGSLLASIFSGRWEGSHDKSQDGCVFLDLDPDCFAEILFQLREQALSGCPVLWKRVPGPKGREKHFRTILRYLGFPKAKSRYLNFATCSATIIINPNKMIASKKNSKGHSYAIGEDILSDGDSWGFQIHALKNNHWILLGIILESEVPANNNSYSNPQANGWANGQIYGKFKDTAEPKNIWTGFKVNDKVTMSIGKSVLKMKVLRIPNTTFTMTIPSNSDWRIHVNLYGANDSVELMQPFDLID